MNQLMNTQIEFIFVSLIFKVSKIAVMERMSTDVKLICVLVTSVVVLPPSACTLTTCVTASSSVHNTKMNCTVTHVLMGARVLD